MNAGEGRKKSPCPRILRTRSRDTIGVLRSGRFIAAIALVAYSIAGSRKRRTLASTGVFVEGLITPVADCFEGP